MWSEVAAGLGGIAAMGLLVRFQQSRINKLDEKKQDKSECHTLVANFNEKVLGLGTEVKALITTTAGQATDIAVIKERMIWLAEKNGFPETKKET